MKDPAKLQNKLRIILRNHPSLRLSLENFPTSESLKGVAWVVQDFVNNSGDVTNDDPLHEWLEEYHFYSQEKRP